MQKGLIGTEAERRIVFIWEGAVANLPDKPAVKAMEYAKRKAHLWDQAVSYWAIDEMTVKWMWSFQARTLYRLDLCVTSRPASFAKAVSRLVEHKNWPFRYVFASTAGSLGRALPTMPDIVRVVYGLPEHRWAFGPQGMAFPGLGQIV